jgi:hypothetical protein
VVCAAKNKAVLFLITTGGSMNDERGLRGHKQGGS